MSKTAQQFKDLLPRRRSLSSSNVVSRFIPITLAALFFLMTPIAPAWAVQAHGGAEGLVAHQVGHILFAAGMAYLLFRLHSMHPEGTDWLHFRIFLWLLLLWNVMTFSGHWMNEFVADEKFIKAGARTLAFKIENSWDAIYYLTRLDHLILVPSFVFLLLALRKWRMSP